MGCGWIRAALVAGTMAGCAAPKPVVMPLDPVAVQVGAAGPALCPDTTASANAAGARATNRARQAAGLPPVDPDPRLARVAAAHACDMARRGRMTHLGTATTGPAMRLKQAGYLPSISAENIAAGPFSLPRVLTEWDISSGHKANILLPQVRHFGLGQAVAQDGRTTYWAAVYSAPQ